MTRLKSLDSYLFRHLFCGLVILIGLSTVSALNSEEKDEAPSEEVHVRKPRFIRIFSRRSEDDNEVESGRNLRNHLGNALEGGTIGIEVGFKPIVERVKRIFTTFREFFPKREYKKSPWDSKFPPLEPPKGKDGGNNENELDDEAFEQPRVPRVLPPHPPKDNDEEIDENEFFDVDPRNNVPVPGFFRERERNTLI